MGMANLPVFQPGECFVVLCDDVIQAWRIGDDGRPEPLATEDRAALWGDDDG